MPDASVHVLKSVEAAQVVQDVHPVGSTTQIVLLGAVGFLLFGLLASWLVWFGVQLDHSLTIEEIRAACARAMPESRDRCVDTVLIQRGGARR